MNNLSNFSFLVSFFKRAIAWKSVTNGIYRKALMYIKQSKIYKIENEKDPLNNIEAYNFYWEPIKSYNKTVRIVRIVIFYDDDNKIKDVRTFCNCDGFKKYKVCSHILATYIKLKSTR